MTRQGFASIAFVLAGLLVSGSDGRAQVPAAHFALDDGSGTTASDATGHGNNGLLVGGGFVWQSGGATPASGGSLVFPATNSTTTLNAGSFVDVTLAPGGGLPLMGLTAQAVTMWVRGAAGQHDRRVYCEGSTVSAYPLLAIGTGQSSLGLTDRLLLYIRNDANQVNLSQASATPVFDGAWHHIAWVDNGGYGVLYVDGAPDAANFTYTRFGTFTMNRVVLGAVGRASVGNYWIGEMDDVRLWGHGLSAVDVAAIMAGGGLGSGYQQNTTAAYADLNGAIGSPGSPARARVPLGAPFVLNLRSNRGGQLWDLAFDSGNAIANGIVLAENIINVNAASPTLYLANGVFSAPFGGALALPGIGGSNGAQVSVAATFTAPAVPMIGVVQFVILNPVSADGFSTSAPVEIEVF